MTEIRKETHWIINTTGWFNPPSWNHTTWSFCLESRHGTTGYSALHFQFTLGLNALYDYGWDYDASVSNINDKDWENTIDAILMQISGGVFSSLAGEVRSIWALGVLLFWIRTSNLTLLNKLLSNTTAADEFLSDVMTLVDVARKKRNIP